MIAEKLFQLLFVSGGQYTQFHDRVLYRRASNRSDQEPPDLYQNENLTEPCIVRGGRVLVTRPKFAFV